MNKQTPLAEFTSEYRIPAEYLESSSFHHSEKDCDTHPFGIRKCPNMSNRHNVCKLCESFPRIKCNTHNLIVCSCGWEFGLHYGVMSKGYKHFKK